MVYFVSLSRSVCRNWRQKESTKQTIQNTSHLQVLARFPLETISSQSAYYCLNPFPLDQIYVCNNIICARNLPLSSSQIDSTVSSPQYIFMYGYVSLFRSQFATPGLDRCRPDWERCSRFPCCHVQSCHFVLPECFHCNINLGHLDSPVRASWCNSLSRTTVTQPCVDTKSLFVIWEFRFSSHRIPVFSISTCLSWIHTVSTLVSLTKMLRSRYHSSPSEDQARNFSVRQRLSKHLNPSIALGRIFSNDVLNVFL